jgi:hypothetical protein
MGFTKFTKRDRNRYKKIYPFVKRTPRWAYMSPVNFQMEVGELSFEGETYKSFSFGEAFPPPPESAPIITVTSLDPNQAINATVFNVSHTGADVSVSNPYHGSVVWHAIWIECPE